MHVRRLHPSDTDPLPARSLAGHDVDVATGNLEYLGQDANEFGIGGPINGWRIEPDQYRIVPDAGDFRPARAWDDTDVDDRAVV